MPIITDPDSVAESAGALEQQVRSMAANLDQYQPTISLGADARLLMVLAQDPNAQTSEQYPRGYSRPLLTDDLPLSMRLQRTLRNVRSLEAKLGPYMMLDLPNSAGSENQTTIQGHATPVGFLPVTGCDVVWNGKGFMSLPGILRISKQWTEQRDIVVPQTDLPVDGQGMVYLTMTVQFREGAEPTESERLVTYKSAAVKFARHGTSPLAGTTIAFDAATQTWTPGEVITPLAWVIPADSVRKAPAVWPMGGSQGPYVIGHAGAMPTFGAGLQPYNAAA